eukprot:469571-Rhodomonas_salina.2
MPYPSIGHACLLALFSLLLYHRTRLCLIRDRTPEPHTTGPWGTYHCTNSKPVVLCQYGTLPFHARSGLGKYHPTLCQERSTHLQVGTFHDDATSVKDNINAAGTAHAQLLCRCRT